MPPSFSLWLHLRPNTTTALLNSSLAMSATDLPTAQAKSKPADVSERGLVSSSGAPVPLLSMHVRGEILDLAAQVG